MVVIITKKRKAEIHESGLGVVRIGREPVVGIVVFRLGSKERTSPQGRDGSLYLFQLW